MENLVNGSTASVADGFDGLYRGRKVLVTGHTGFKGAWLSEWLLMLGANVTGVALDPPTEPSLFRQLELSGRINDLRADVRDAGRLLEIISSERPDTIFHLAAQPLVRLSYTQPVETFETNVMGSVNLMEAVRRSGNSCVVVMITTDKCYENREWLHSYREEDAMGGHDPYSASKGCAEIAISAYRRSFFSSGKQAGQIGEPRVALASARAGNVLGGGDWADDRIVPDCIRALQRGHPIPVRNKTATRPWQHVLEPLSGYLQLGAKIGESLNSSGNDRQAVPIGQLCSAFNFGPAPDSNRTVAELVVEVLKHWPGQWNDQSEPDAPHEAGRLNLSIDKAFHLLKWKPVWTFEETVGKTAAWYQKAVAAPDDSSRMLDFTRRQIEEYCRQAEQLNLSWMLQTALNH